MPYPHGLFTWTDIALPDPNAGAAFYTALFGWEATDQHGPDGAYIYTMFTKDGAPIAGLGPEPPGSRPQGVPPMWTSYVTVDDLAATIERWTDAGGTVLMPAMDVATAGRMAVVADLEGAILALWQAGDHAGAERFNEPGTMTWNELYTRDAAAARRFYASTLGWTFERWEDESAPPDYWFIRVDRPASPVLAADGYNGGIMTMDETWPAGVPAHWMVYFAVADADETVEHLEDLGGSVSVPPFDVGGGRMAVVADPQGGMFSIASWPSS